MKPQTVINKTGVWCSWCNAYVQILSIRRAAQLAGVDRRSIYRYLEEGKVNSFTIAGGCRRVCSNCLIHEDMPGGGQNRHDNLAPIRQLSLCIP